MNKTTTLQRSGQAERINALHAEIGAAMLSAFDKALTIGDLLTQAKAACGHGDWGKWMEANLTFTARTASNYMRLAEHRELFKSETVSDLTTAYRMLQEPKAAASLPAPTGEPPTEPGPLDFPHDARLITPDGCLLCGFGREHISGEELWIYPSDTDGFYHIAQLLPDADNEADGGTAGGTMEPVAGPSITLHVEHLMHRSYRDYDWHSGAVQARPYQNVFMWDSADAYKAHRSAKLQADLAAGLPT